MDNNDKDKLYEDLYGPKKEDTSNNVEESTNNDILKPKEETTYNPTPVRELEIPTNSENSVPTPPQSGPNKGVIIACIVVAGLALLLGGLFIYNNVLKDKEEPPKPVQIEKDKPTTKDTPTEENPPEETPPEENPPEETPPEEKKEEENPPKDDDKKDAPDTRDIYKTGTMEMYDLTVEIPQDYTGINVNEGLPSYRYDDAIASFMYFPSDYMYSCLVSVSNFEILNEKMEDTKYWLDYSFLNYDYTPTKRTINGKEWLYGEVFKTTSKGYIKAISINHNKKNYTITLEYVSNYDKPNNYCDQTFPKIIDSVKLK